MFSIFSNKYRVQYPVATAPDRPKQLAQRLLYSADKTIYERVEQEAAVHPLHGSKKLSERIIVAIDETMEKSTRFLHSIFRAISSFFIAWRSHRTVISSDAQSGVSADAPQLAQVPENARTRVMAAAQHERLGRALGGGVAVPPQIAQVVAPPAVPPAREGAPISETVKQGVKNDQSLLWFNEEVAGMSDVLLLRERTSPDGSCELFPHGGFPRLQDIDQGSEHEDCAWLACVAGYLVAHGPEAVKSLFQDNKDGTVTVTLPRPAGQPEVKVTVSTQRFVRGTPERHHDVYSQGAPWVRILEKAIHVYLHQKAEEAHDRQAAAHHVAPSAPVGVLDEAVHQRAETQQVEEVPSIESLMARDRAWAMDYVATPMAMDNLIGARSGVLDTLDDVGRSLNAGQVVVAGRNSRLGFCGGVLSRHAVVVVGVDTSERHRGLWVFDSYANNRPEPSVMADGRILTGTPNISRLIFVPERVWQVDYEKTYASAE